MVTVFDQARTPRSTGTRIATCNPRPKRKDLWNAAAQACHVAAVRPHDDSPAGARGMRLEAFPDITGAAELASVLS